MLKSDDFPAQECHTNAKCSHGFTVIDRFLNIAWFWCEYLKLTLSNIISHLVIFKAFALSLFLIKNPSLEKIIISSMSLADCCKSLIWFQIFLKWPDIIW